MIVEIFGNGEISVSGCETASDGIYIPIRQFAEEHDVPETQARVWKYRGNIETVTIFGSVFVKKNCPVLLRRCTEKRAKI